jgi:hypothetical protein
VIDRSGLVREVRCGDRGVLGVRRPFAGKAYKAKDSLSYAERCLSAAHSLDDAGEVPA